MTKLSVIVPIYNVEKYLKKGIESIINQTLKEIEIILINDGSTDNSLNICEEYQDKDCRIKVVNKKREGVSEARNVGMKMAQSEYIVFFDPDDEIEQEMYENLYSAMEKLNYDICFCKYKRIRNNEENIDEFEGLINEKNEIEIEKLIKKIIGGDFIEDKLLMGCVWRSVFKKDIIERFKIKFPEGISPMQDLVFMIEYLTKCRNAFLVNRYYYKYFINSGSSTNRYRGNLLDNNIKVYNLLENILKENRILEQNYSALKNRQINLYLSILSNETKEVNIKNKSERIDNINKLIKNEEVCKLIKGIDCRKLSFSKKIQILLIKNKRKTLIFYGQIIERIIRNKKEQLYK